ncbi:Non-canonical non-ribosomal peptide synthetase FUB8 [Lachnellula suecica]|uniref:Non-canonical non-ribosomal peptide synthetase FUB8 n=1 Tax=Lachnellula suecica TaxID=602035 RepID=A0A8T9C9V2_9HELO|nr:Non-canonical non-ribosomal peptide synthetase FUB8 [Lachnellula suecica]
MDSSYDSTTYGKRLLPHIVDGRARSGYPRPYAMYPLSRDCSKGFQSISYARLANAGTFAYLGPNDLRYVILVLAAMKTSRKILICSLRNTVEAQSSLFNRAHCKALVFCSSLNQSLLGLFSVLDDVREFEAPGLEEILAEDLVAHYNYDETYETAGNDAIIHFHTSGSSGNPKPISWNKSVLCSLDAGNILPTNQGASLTKEFLGQQNLLTLLPCFHAGGMAFSFFPAFYEMTLVLGHPSVPMSAHYVSRLLEPGVVTAILTPPSILADLFKDSRAVERLAKLQHIGYAGGPLQPDVGNKLATIVPHLFSYIGATEEGWFYNISGENSTWDSLRYFSDIGYQFDEVSEGIFELVIVNDPRTNKYHGVFVSFPTLKEYRTRDLYAPNPIASGWMRYRGRADDLIVLSNGEKINPIPMENVICSIPSVKAALVVGEYRFNPSLLIELEEDKIPKTDAERHEALNQVWPSVQEANKIAPGFAKVPKSLILFASAEKPFQRAGKGTVQRQFTVKSYAKELEDLFLSQEASLLTEGLTLPKAASPEDVKIFVREIYTQALEHNELKDSDDVFQHGVDSLKVAILVSRLQAALRCCEIPLDTVDIGPRLVYSAPSIDRITESIIHLAKGSNNFSITNGGATKLRKENMGRLLAKYSTDITPVATAAELAEPEINTSQEAWNIILTGTTGSLGSHLLTALYEMPRTKVKKIICLNRFANAEVRQEKSCKSRGLKSTWDEQRVKFLQTDLSQDDLGLGPETYAALLHESSVIIHTAWQVDFNLNIDSFEPQIKGLRNLLDFSAKSANKATLIFMSSISAALGWLEKNPEALVPEAIINDTDAPEQMGYAESKYVTERLIEKFATASGINAAIFRTGQIAGSLSGNRVWNKQEWFPSLISSSKHLGVLPESLGSMEIIDWVPVDLMASMVVQLTDRMIRKSSRADGETTVYNLVNPRPTTWSKLCTPIQKLSGIPRTMPLDKWVSLLEESSKERNGAVMETNPAIKLLDFFRLLGQKQTSSDKHSRYDVTGLVRDSPTAGELEAVSSEWIRLWLGGWI